MIVPFGNRATSDFYHGISSRRARKIPGQIKAMAQYKLDILNAVQSLEDLKSPQGNRLEALIAIFRVTTAFESMISGELSSYGKIQEHMKFRSLITTNQLQPGIT